MIVGGASQASAEALTLEAIDSFIQYRVCVNACAPTSTTCIDACASPEQAWDKNNDASYSNVDLELAVLEYWDEGTETYICYDNDAVVPVAACNADNCLTTYTRQNVPMSTLMGFLNGLKHN